MPSNYLTHEQIRNQFPLFQSQTSLAYLDSAASSQQPQEVIDGVQTYMSSQHSNVHRGVYKLSEEATQAFENTRQSVASFIGGVDADEVIFSSGTTESLNLVAQSWGSLALKPGDEILLPISEHHSNIVPWQIVAQRQGAKLRFIPLTEGYRLNLEAARSMISSKTKIITCGHVSNILGVIQPVKELAQMAKSVGATFVVDGAQGAPHLPVDVKDIGCDFYTFSAHKLCGPTGVGILWGRKELLDQMPPYKGGGEMILKVTTEGSTWKPIPHKFEAGTPNIAGVIGLDYALKFFSKIDRKKALESDLELGTRVFEELKKNSRVTVYLDQPTDWIGILSFYHQDIHPHDLASIMDQFGVCVRAGHHCGQPLMDYLGVSATTRVSPFIYNTHKDIDRFFEALEKAQHLFKI